MKTRVIKSLGILFLIAHCVLAYIPIGLGLTPSDEMWINGLNAITSNTSYYGGDVNVSRKLYVGENLVMTNAHGGNISTYGEIEAAKLMATNYGGDGGTLSIKPNGIESDYDGFCIANNEFIDIYSDNCGGSREMSILSDEVVIYNDLSVGGYVSIYNDGLYVEDTADFNGDVNIEDAYISTLYVTGDFNTNADSAFNGRVNILSEAENKKFLFGVSSDVAFQFDGSDMRIESQDVTANDNLYLNGFDMVYTNTTFRGGYESADGNPGITDSTSYWLSTSTDGSSFCQAIYENGLLVDCT